jgi:hypothetical protein
MILYLIKKIIKNDDIAYHIYNLYIISKKFERGTLTLSNTKLFLDKYIKDEYYTNIILNKINFKNNFNIINIKKLFINDDIIIKILKYNPAIIKHLDYKYKNNPIIINNICLYNSYYFKFASNNLKNDINFIINLLDINFFIYFFIDDELKKNKDIIIKINKSYPIINDINSNLIHL